VRVEFEDPRLHRDASWDGDSSDFFERIAPARTFALAKDVPALVARGLGKGAVPASVLVIAEDEIYWSGRPFEADEPARHKLLDLVGDLYLHGGPPLGSVLATRPGHAANHAAIAEALARGVLSKEQR
jgi:UDP-3-O-[3-hydroxymyristoyl] N-acetylglucosamine deacetylase